MAKPLIYTEMMVARFEPGTFARIDAVLANDEARADFVRDAVLKQPVRRERSGRRKPQPAPRRDR